MAIGWFLDPEHAPGRASLEAALGPSLGWWQRLEAWLDSTYGIVGEPVFFGRDSGWSLRFRRAGHALLTLTPMADGPARALVVIGPTAWADVEAASLSAGVRDAWATAKPYPDGRWLWLRLTDEAVVDDVETLVALKSPPPRRPRRRSPAGVPSPA